MFSDEGLLLFPHPEVTPVDFQDMLEVLMDVRPEHIAFQILRGKGLRGILVEVSDYLASGGKGTASQSPT